MSRKDNERVWDDFPDADEYVDFAGKTRCFRLELALIPVGYGLRAIEEGATGQNGYEFSSYSRIDPIEALADLRKRIPQLLSIRHLVKQQGRLSLTHDRLRGRVTDGGVVVDGIFIDFDQLASMLQVYEGSQFDLRIVDLSEEL